jgi:glycosyltransferase involved in cell wall biosynthesis
MAATLACDTTLRMTQSPTDRGNVSIVIPCFNDGAMIQEALASVDAVRNENVLEVIIVDVGSAEARTRRILNEVAEARARVVHQANQGPRAARNTGIRLAKGEFILPLDSDNRLRDAYLNEAVSMLKNNPCLGVVYSDAEYFGERTGRWHVQEFNLLSLIRGNFIDACALYRKSLWEKVGGYDEQMPWMGWEDWDFWLRVAYRGGNFVHLPKVGFDYRVRRDSLRMNAQEHGSDLLNYIFGKPEMACYRLVREMDEQAQTLRARMQGTERLIQSLQETRSYRLGRALLAPAQLLRKLWRRFC